MAVAAAEPTGGHPRRRAPTGSAAGALVLAFLALYRRRLPVLRRGYQPGRGLVAPVRRVQTGVLKITSRIVFDVACLGGVFAFLIRLPSSAWLGGFARHRWVAAPACPYLLMSSPSYWLRPHPGGPLRRRRGAPTRRLPGDDGGYA